MVGHMHYSDLKSIHVEWARQALTMRGVIHEGAKGIKALGKLLKADENSDGKTFCPKLKNLSTFHEYSTSIVASKSICLELEVMVVNNKHQQ